MKTRSLPLIQRRAMVAALTIALLLTTAVGHTTPTRADACTGNTLHDGAWTYPPAPLWPSTDGGFGQGVPLIPPTAGFGNAPGETQVIVGPRGSQRMLITDGSSVLRSLNGGCTWTSILSVNSTDPHAIQNGLPFVDTPESSIGLIAVPPTAAPSAQKTIYATIGDHVQNALLRSTDDGATWKSITPGTPVANGALVLQPNPARWLSVAASDPATLYLCNCYQANGGAGQTLYASRDSGNAWSTMTLPIPAGTSTNSQVYWGDVRIDPHNPRSLWVFVHVQTSASGSWSETTALYHSADGGATWAPVATGTLAQPQDVQFYWPAKAKRPWVLTSSRDPIQGSCSSTFCNVDSPRLSTDGGRTWKSLAPLALRSTGFLGTFDPFFGFDRSGRIIGATVIYSRPFLLGRGSPPLTVMRLSGRGWRQLSAGLQFMHGYVHVQFAQTSDTPLRLIFAVDLAASPDYAAAEYVVPNT